jgi:hypothetical protein
MYVYSTYIGTCVSQIVKILNTVCMYILYILCMHVIWMVENKLLRMNIVHSTQIACEYYYT